MAAKEKSKSKQVGGQVKVAKPANVGERELLAQAIEHHRAGRYDEAEALYGKILQANPLHHDSLHLAGMVAFARGDFGRARTLIEQALQLKPKADIYLGNLANVLHSQGDYEGALRRFREAIAANPKNAVPYANMGNLLSDQGRLAESVETYEQALQLDPNFYEALFNLALSQRGLGRVDAAVATFRRAISVSPQQAPAHYSLAQTLLLKGDLAEGWREYEWRWSLDEYGWLKSIHGEFHQPRWAGEPLPDGTLLVYSEQGMGDTLHFVRLLPAVAARVKRLIFAAYPRLMAIIGPALAGIPNVSLVSLDAIPLPPFDVHSPLLSLPRLLGINSISDIPLAKPYLHADPARVTEWRQRLDTRPGLRIGIAWQGKPDARIDRGRSPPLAAYAPLARIPGVRLIALQQRDGLDQLDRLPPGMTVERLGGGVDADGAFVDTAAIMAGLDLIIVSDSSIAHLAGGLGVKVWLAVKHIPDWRWLLEGERNPWYPSMRLFRQSFDGDWPGVFEAMARAIESEFAARLVAAEAPLLPVPSDAGMPLTPVSWGELIDKISILDIKSERLSDSAKLLNVRRELAELVAVRERHFPAHAALREVYGRLKKVNESLWQIEDDIRDCERARDFGARFVELARAVYVTNDLRADLKREINDLLGSTLKEEKSYKPYTDNQAAAVSLLQTGLGSAAQATTAAPASAPLSSSAAERLVSTIDRLAHLPRLSIDQGLGRSVCVQMLERLRQEGVLAQGRRVLDVAVGQGEVLAWLVANGLMAQGLCAQADAQALQQRGLNVLPGNDTLLAALPEASVDLVWSHQSLQRSAAPFHTLSEYRRVLSAGGYLYVDVPVPDTVVRHQAIGSNVSLFGQSMWQELFVRAGFSQAWGIELASGSGDQRDVVWAFLLRA